MPSLFPAFSFSHYAMSLFPFIAKILNNVVAICHLTYLSHSLSSTHNHQALSSPPTETALAKVSNNLHCAISNYHFSLLIWLKGSALCGTVTHTCLEWLSSLGLWVTVLSCIPSNLSMASSSFKLPLCHHTPLEGLSFLEAAPKIMEINTASSPVSFVILFIFIEISLTCIILVSVV